MTYRNRWTGVVCRLVRRRGWWCEIQSIWSGARWRIDAWRFRSDYDEQ